MMDAAPLATSPKAPKASPFINLLAANPNPATNPIPGIFFNKALPAPLVTDLMAVVPTEAAILAPEPSALAPLPTAATPFRAPLPTAVTPFRAPEPSALIPFKAPPPTALAPFRAPLPSDLAPFINPPLPKFLNIPPSFPCESVLRPIATVKIPTATFKALSVVIKFIMVNLESSIESFNCSSDVLSGCFISTLPLANADISSTDTPIESARAFLCITFIFWNSAAPPIWSITFLVAPSKSPLNANSLALL